MMQFSAAPWRVLDKRHLAAVKSAVDVRSKFVARFMDLARECAKTGEPMLRNLEYVFSGNGYAAVKDQFMMGDFLMVAPQTAKGAKERTVLVPPGTWKCDDGTTVTGPCKVTVSTPLDRIPHFVKSAQP
jgi:alpha-glucosidase (family GH31 glycosyl hydrolase)